MKQHVIKLTKDILIARRQGNVIREQKAYDKLFAYCSAHNIDFDDAINGATRWIRANDAAAVMQGW